MNLQKTINYHKSSGTCKRGSRGGDWGPDPTPPPLDLSDVGSCVEAWWVGEGVQRLFLPYHSIQIFSGSLRLPVLYKHYMYTYFQVQCSVWNRHPFSIFALFKFWKVPNTPSLPCFYKRAFSYFSCLELHNFTPFKQNFFRGKTPRPPSLTHLQYQNYHVWSVFCEERGLLWYKRPCPTEEITLYVNNCLESWFEPYFYRMDRTNATLRFLVSSVSSPPPFFFAYQNFRKVGPPPPDENSLIRAWVMSFINWKLQENDINYVMSILLV